MTPDQYFTDRFAALEKEWKGGNFPALAQAVAEAHFGGVPIPEWAVDPVLENLQWAYWHKTGKGAPKKVFKERYCAAQRWRAADLAMTQRDLENAKDRSRRRWQGKAHPKPVTEEEAFRAALKALQGTPWGSVEWDAIRKAYQRVRRALKAGKGYLYGL